jgi:hypothetical protein
MKGKSNYCSVCVHFALENPRPAARELEQRLADYAERYTLATAMHFAGSPIGFLAAVHCTASFASFTALEHHGLDMPF